MSAPKAKQQDHTHTHGAGCSHDHHHDHDEKEIEKKEPEIDPKQVIEDKINSVQQSICAIDSGLQRMQESTEQNIHLVEKEFTDLIAKLALRRDTLMKQLNEIALDKKEMLCAQKQELEEYSTQLQKEKEKEDININIADRDVSLSTKPDILLSIDNDALSSTIRTMGFVNNYFAPNPPRITIEDVKAHTAKVSFYETIGKYDGFEAASSHIVEIAWGPKKGGNDDEKSIDFSKLKWKQIAEKSNARFIKIKKLKPATVYYVRVKCANSSGLSVFCVPMKLETVVLKINTKIMTSDEIEILIDLIKSKRSKKSIEWKLLFRGSDDGFLAGTFHMKCDDIANTVCVIESNHGNVFGGFTTLPWKSDVGRYHVDEEAFVFIVRKKKKALKKALMYLQYTSSQHSVVHNKYMGPVFGYGHDIYIRNKADKVEDNSCRNHTYQCSYAGELAGKEKFKCINYEVFQIAHPEDDVEAHESEDDEDDEDDDDDDDN